MSITNFIKHDARGFDVPEEMSIEDREKLCSSTFQFISASWMDGAGNKHTLNTHDFSVHVLPDRSGLICLETPKSVKDRYVGRSGAIILNEDGSVRYRLKVPIELLGYEVPPDSVCYFAWVEYSEARNQYGLTAVITYAGEYYFELDYLAGKFLWGKPIRF